MGGRISGSDFSNTDPTVERRGCSSTGKFLGAKKMWHGDHGTAFAAEALTGLHAGPGPEMAIPRVSPAGEAARGDEFAPETEGNGDQGVQGATQGTQGVAPAAAQAAAQPYASAQQVAMATALINLRRVVSEMGSHLQLIQHRSSLASDGSSSPSNSTANLLDDSSGFLITCPDRPFR